jgi:hypothetical protein
MTVEITIPIFETFWNLVPSLRLGIAMLVAGLICIGTPYVLFHDIQIHNPFTQFGIFCLVIAVIAFGMYGAGVAYDFSMQMWGVDPFKLPELPVSFRIV